MTSQPANPFAHPIETAEHLGADPDNSIAFTRNEENSFVREFRTPHFRVIMGHLRRLGIVREGAAT